MNVSVNVELLRHEQLLDPSQLSTQHHTTELLSSRTNEQSEELRRSVFSLQGDWLERQSKPIAQHRLGATSFLTQQSHHQERVPRFPVATKHHETIGDS